VRNERKENDIRVPQRSDCPGPQIWPGRVGHEGRRGAGKRNGEPCRVVLERRRMAAEQDNLLLALGDGDAVQLGWQDSRERHGLRRNI
jgi:hypothetical protein